MNFRLRRTLCPLFALCLFLFFCTQAKADPAQKEYSVLSLAFTGDLMAHSENYKTSDYSLIYKDVESIFKKSDLVFTNLETPVDNSKPYSSYPSFNVHGEYVEAAINAGINVFSLANNHSNDLNKDSMLETKAYFDGLNDLGVFSSGLREGPGTEFTWTMIEKNGWKILFLPVTELLNWYGCLDYVNYVPYNKSGRQQVYELVKKLREENPCDLFVLSVHCDDTEYVTSVKDARRTYYNSLLEAGADIVWANHPHILREWDEIYPEGDIGGNPNKLIFYGFGNLVSGQRRNPDYTNPGGKDESKGDSMIFSFDVHKNGENIYFTRRKVDLITTHIEENRDFVIRRLTSDFFENLSEPFKTYYSERRKLLMKTEGHRR